MGGKCPGSAAPDTVPGARDKDNPVPQEVRCWLMVDNVLAHDVGSVPL